MTNITYFDTFVLLASIPSEISTLPYSNTYNSLKHSAKTTEDNNYHLLEKQI